MDVLAPQMVQLGEVLPSYYPFFYVGVIENGRENFYCLGRDIRPTRDDKDQQSAFHPLSGRVQPSSVTLAGVNRKGQNIWTLNTKPESSQRLMYSCGWSEGIDYTLPDSAFTHLHLEPTPAFSGEGENQQILAQAICLGRELSKLPAFRNECYPEWILKIQDPSAKLVALRACDAHRASRAWVDLHYVADNITRHGEKNHMMYSPGDWPDQIRGLRIYGGQAYYYRTEGQPMKLQGSNGLFQQELFKHLGIKSKNPLLKGVKLVTQDDIANTIYHLPSGNYRNDPRVKAWLKKNAPQK